MENVHRYDDFKDAKPYVFLGEYAACYNTGKSALAEAAYMTQLQNACHAVKLACYAPLLCHKDYENWKPDMIWFDNEKLCKSVNYQVQKLFMNHQGDALLPYRLEGSFENQVLCDVREKKSGDICLAGNDSHVVFSHIVIRDLDSGKEMQFEEREILAGEEEEPFGISCPENYSVSLHAKELEGRKGFKIYFAWKNEKNRMCWVLGGWDNQDGAITEERNGKNSFLTQNQFEVGQGVEYALELRVCGNHVEGWINGDKFQETALKETVVEPLYLTASRESGSGDIILKAVNLREENMAADICLPEDESGEYNCTEYQLREAECRENKDFPGVENCGVRCFERCGIKNVFNHEFPGRTVTVIRLHKIIRK